MADEPGDEPPAEEPKYNQAFFLDLAAKGKDAWNAWRRDPTNKDARVTFAGADFSEAPRDRIIFAGFEFGDGADFSSCKWRGGELESILSDLESSTLGFALFTGAAFGSNANFTGAVFGDLAFFDGAIFGRDALFVNAIFGDWATFPGAAFSSGANFTGADFGASALFSHAAFDGWATFTGAAFGDCACFTAAFDGDTNFSGAAFGDGANFTGAALGQTVNFAGAIFKGLVEFTGQPEEKWAEKLTNAFGFRITEKARDAFEKLREKLYEKSDFWPDRFFDISFAGARFEGPAFFSGRSFEQSADFTNARFYSPPDFDAATSLDRIDFTGAHIGFVPPGELLHWTEDSQVPVRLRALRKIADETKNHDLARDLYIEERKAERGVYLHQLLGLDELKKKLEDINKQKKHVWLERRLQRRARNAHWLGILVKPVKIARLIRHLLWIAVMGLYWALANYGRDFVLPALWLALSVPFFYLGYAKILAPLKRAAGPLEVDKYEHAMGMLALGNAVPFVGPLTIDADIKKFLFCPGGEANCLPIPPEGYQLLVVGQNVLSIILVFFIGLALRNYFKIK